MAISLVSAGSFAAGTGTVTPELPAGWQQYDILVLFIECASGDTPSVPDGYTDALSKVYSGKTQLMVGWKRAGSSESAPTVPDAGNHTAACIAAFRGCVRSGDPFNASATDQEYAKSSAMPSITTTVNGCMVVNYATVGGANQNTDSWTNNNLVSIAEIFDQSHAQGSNGGMFAACGIKATAGSTGSTTYVYTSATYHAQSTFALAPYIDPLSAGSGSFGHTGTAAILLRSSLVTAGAGEYTLVGSDVTLTKTVAGTYILSAEEGAFVLSGKAADLFKSLLVGAGPGTFDLSGSPANLLKSGLVGAGSGEFALTGQDVEFVYLKQTLVVHDIIHDISVTNIDLIENKTFSVETGAFTLTGTAASLLVSGILTASPGSLTLTGHPASFIHTILIVIHNMIHSVATDAPTLIVPSAYNVTVHDIIHGITFADDIDVVLIMPETLTVHDVIHVITIDHIGLIMPGSLTVHDMVHGITVANTTLRGFEYGEVASVINIGGAWKLIADIKVLINGAWKTVNDIRLRQ